MFRCFALLVAVALGSCAGKPAIPPPKPTIRSLAVVPATPPRVFSLANYNALEVAVPISSLGFAADRRTKTDVMSKTMLSRPNTLAEDFTNTVVQSLRSHGYTVRILENIPRVVDDPDYIDYDKLEHDADAVLHLYFTDVGLYSGRTSTSYVPRVNVQGIVHSRRYPEYLYEGVIYYGADATRSGAWAMAADPKFAYPSFEYVLNNFDSVRADFQSAVRLISERMAEQIHAAIK